MFALEPIRVSYSSCVMPGGNIASVACLSAGRSLPFMLPSGKSIEFLSTRALPTVSGVSTDAAISTFAEGTSFFLGVF